MAGVQSRSAQKFFSREIQNLSTFFVGIGEVFMEIAGEELSLGGISIRIPDLGNTKLGQAIKNMDIEAVRSIFYHLGETLSGKGFKKAVPRIMPLLLFQIWESVKFI